MSLTLFIGDTGEYLAVASNKHSKDSCLLNNANFKKKMKGVYYTSLGDLDEDRLYSVGQLADKIVYCPPDIWSTRGIADRTMVVLRDLYLIDKKDIEYVSGERVKFELNTAFLKLQDRRKTERPQLWVCGCSFAYGAALKDQNQRYGQLIANHFNVPVSFLAEPGTGVDWAADQILRADIKPNDTVIWGITCVNRITWFDKRHEMLKLNFGYLTEDLKHYFGNRVPAPEEKMMLQHMLFDDSRLLLSIRYIEQIITYCKRQSINLILMVHDELSLERHAEWLMSYLENNKSYVKIQFNSDPWEPEKQNEGNAQSLLTLVKHRKYLDGSDNPHYKTFYKHIYEDLGLDKVHPGPLTHRYVADQLIAHIEQNRLI